MPKQIDNEYLNMREACALLRVHPNTLRNWTKSGRLKAKRVGTRGDRRFSKQELLKLLEYA